MKSSSKARILRQTAQAVCLALFLWLLWDARWPLAASVLPHDLFLRLDPLVAFLVPITAREVVSRILPGLAVIVLALFFGRVFCGYICPMGTTLDLARPVVRLAVRPSVRLTVRLFGGKDGGNGEASGRGWRGGKYLICIAMVVAAFLGGNILFWGSPIALITRFYGLLVHSGLLLAGDTALKAGHPLFESLDWTGLSYLAVSLRRFDTLVFILFFFATLFVLERVRPRFWCRYVCPAGALLALAALRPLWRRRVSACTGCGGCVRACPTGCIAPDGVDTLHGECITCRTCVDVCPVRGVSFTCGPVRTELRGRAAKRDEREEDAASFASASRCLTPLPSRRAFLGAAGAGAALASARCLGLPGFPRFESREGLLSEGLVRPPGSLPELEFLARCIRCGECMKACPTNTLQPVWLAAGVEGMFSPVIMPRTGPCEPDCTVCGQVCPTQAIRALPVDDKHWAKVGTAVVRQSTCLAWAEGRECMVCQEVCPFGSVKIVRQEGHTVSVPVVDPARCFGCGYCEYHCPTARPSIVVMPLSSLRLSGGSYRTAAQSQGLTLNPGIHGQANETVSEDDLPPGFSE